jgi:transposase
LGSGLGPRSRRRPAGKTSKFSPEKKLQIVLSVLRGEVKVAEAARRHATSETSVGKCAPSGREAQLEHDVAELTQALGEAHLELRILKRGGAAGFATRSWR